MRVLILDTESTGLGAGHEPNEVAGIVYDYVRKAMVSCWSVTLEVSVPNEAFEINHIPDGLGQVTRTAAMTHMMRLANMCDHIIAHKADYDRGVLTELNGYSWLCSYVDIRWPKSGPRNLSDLCLRHGVSMARAHRAIDDCLGLVSLFDRVGEKHDLELLLQEAVQRRDEPRVHVEAVVEFHNKDKAKAAGFQWDGKRRIWWKALRQSELAAAKEDWQFKVVELEGAP